MSDHENIVAALNLEFGANRRYGYQIENSPFSRLNTLLEGVRRTEGDHIEALMERIKAAQLASEPDAGRGFASMLAHLRLDLEFERLAVREYGRFGREAEDPEVRAMFKSLARSEVGHVKLFERIVEEVAHNRHPVFVYCPICGWELDFGVNPEEGVRVKCERCRQLVTIAIQDGDFVPRAV